MFMNGLVAETAINPEGANGAFFGNPMQIAKQIVGIVVTAVWCIFWSYVLAILVHWTFGLRSNRSEEKRGLDRVFHDEEEVVPLSVLKRMVQDLQESYGVRSHGLSSADHEEQ